MKKKRLIPVLLLRNGFLVQSKEFSRYQNLGNPTTAVKRVSDWMADELIYLDISQDDHYDMRRNDLATPNRTDPVSILQDVSRTSNMPISFGGKIRSLEHMLKFLSNGADKICLNTGALETPELVKQGAQEFGSQCIIVSIDFKKINGEYKVMLRGKKEETSWKVLDWCKEVENLGAGEILLNSIDRDGMRTGFEIEIYQEVASKIKIPIIACGGVGEWSHFAEALEQTEVDAVAAANIFHYYDQSVYLARKYLFERGLPVRRPDLI